MHPGVGGSRRTRRHAIAAVSVATTLALGTATAAIAAQRPATRTAPQARHLAVHFSGGAVHLTVLGPDTGAYAQIGQAMYEGAADGAAMVNAAGGILGHQLILDKVDTHGDPADAVPALQQELAKNHPAAIVGPVTLEIFGVKPVIDQNKIVDLFNGGSTVFDTNKDPYIWRINPSDSQEAVAIAEYARQRGFKKAAILFTTEASQQELEPFLVKDFKALGGTIVSTTNVTPGASSYNSEILKLVHSHPQVILGQLDPATAATFFSEFTGINGHKTPMIGTDLTAGGDWVKAVGYATSNALVTSVEGATPTNPAGNAFNAIQQKTWHHAALSGANYAYDGVVDVALAMDAAKGTTTADIQRGLILASNPPGATAWTYAEGLALLKKGKKINYQGASGPMDFNKNHNVAGPWVVVRANAKNGNFVTVETISAAQVSAASSKIH